MAQNGVQWYACCAYFRSAMRQLFYDLTELLYLSHGFRSYYGIARVVAEGAHAAYRAGVGARFVAFSQAHGAFFEVFPSDHPTRLGEVALNVPNPGKPYFTRRMFTGKRRALHHVAPFLFGMSDAIQRRQWAKWGASNPTIDMAGGAWVSCARPKLMIHAVESLRSQDVEVHAFLHDVIPMHEDLWAGRASFHSSFHGDTNYLIETADHIIANSHYTAEDIEAFARQGQLATPKRMSVAQLAHELCPGLSEPALDIPDRPYFMMVGTALGRKNLDVALAAMDRLAKTGGPLPLLVLAGRRRKRTMDMLERPEWAHIRPFVHQIDSPTQTDLKRLYGTARGVILPSKIEGWGLPAAEALWTGVPALCSDIPVFHEVCGDLALYFHADEAAALAGHMRRLLTDEAFERQVREAIVAGRGQLRTWQDFGRDLIASVTDGTAEPPAEVTVGQAVLA